MRIVFIMLVSLLVLNSCQDKAVQWLNKKWDCVKIDNLDPIDKKTFTSAKDSLNAAKIESALTELNWTFNNDNSYRCSVGDKTVTQGTYHLAGKNTLICKSFSGNINTYNIEILSEDELVLSSQENNVHLVMHFKPH